MKARVLLTNETKPKSISDLKNNDHVGFIDDSGMKGYIIYDGKYIAIDSGRENVLCNYCYGNRKKSLVGAILEANENTGYKMQELFVFDTRKELYKWLSE